MTLGLLLGLSIFARIDAALFALALGIDALRRGAVSSRRSLAVAAVTVVGSMTYDSRPSPSRPSASTDSPETPGGVWMRKNPCCGRPPMLEIWPGSG